MFTLVIIEAMDGLLFGGENDKVKLGILFHVQYIFLFYCVITEWVSYHHYMALRYYYDIFFGEFCVYVRTEKL